MFGALLDLVFPQRCVGCGAEDGPLCPACRPPEAVPGIDAGAAVAAVPYEGAVRAVLLAYKERGRRDLAGLLARLLAASVRLVAAPWAAAGATPRPVLVPPPSATAVAAARGGDHLRPLARRAGRQCGLGSAPGVLTYGRTVRDSAGLSQGERAANLRDAMIAGPAPPGVAALLVDDIVTTGATLGEAARALRAAGWPVIGSAVIAATPLRRPGPASARPGTPLGAVPASPLAAPSRTV